MNKKCQVFTPPHIANELLDSIDYTNDIFGKKIIENACGDGNILKEVVKRYINDAFKQEKSLKEIKQRLEIDIYGIEIDKVHSKKCIENLDSIANSFGIENVSWKIINKDFLELNINCEFDFVVGNPPYISYRELDVETRTFLKEKYTSCKSGKFDYCYPFIEASIKCLNHNGRLAYIIPNSVFKNVFATSLREFILMHLTKITDFTTIKLFDKVLTSSAIINCTKNSNNTYFQYKDVAGAKEYIIEKATLNEKWKFSLNNSPEMAKRNLEIILMLL